MIASRNSIPAEVLSPLTRSAVVFVGFNLIYGVLQAGIDVADHIGGLAAGFACGLILSVPLTVEPPPRRAARNAAVLLGSGILMAGVAAKLPRPVDFMAEFKSFGAVEIKTLAAYRADLDQARNRKLTDEQVADLIEKNVLPDWASERRRLAALKGLPTQAQGIMSSVLKYMDGREQGWALVAKGLRAHDANAIKAGGAKSWRPANWPTRSQTRARIGNPETHGALLDQAVARDAANQLRKFGYRHVCSLITIKAR